MLARKLCREEDFVEGLKREQNEVKRAEEEDQRLSEGFEVLIRHEINRRQKEREMQRERGDVTTTYDFILMTSSPDRTSANFDKEIRRWFRYRRRYNFRI